MNIKRFFLIFLCLATLVCAVACGGGNDSSVQSAEQSLGDSSAAEASENGSNEASVSSDADNGLPFVSHTIRTGSNADGMVYPQVTIISSAPELTTYYMQNKGTHDLNDAFKNVMNNYDVDFFQSKVLLMVVVNANSGSVEYTTKGVTLTADGRLNVKIECYQPAAATLDLAVWHILIELDKSYAVTADKVDVVIDRTE